MKWYICHCIFRGMNINVDFKYRIQANSSKGLEPLATALAIQFTQNIPEKVWIEECPIQMGATA